MSGSIAASKSGTVGASGDSREYTRQSVVRHMATFCDWLAGAVAYPTSHPINGGYICILKPTGEVERTFSRGLSVQGSHGSEVRIEANGARLWFSGNPSKWFQGHNAYGLPPSPELAAWFVRDIMRRVAGESGRDALVSFDPATIQLSRIDVTRMYRPEWAESGWVPQWLRRAAVVARSRQRKTSSSLADGGTLYFGGTRRIQLKFYDKAAELRKHQIDIAVKQASPFDPEEYSRDSLRVEVEIRGMELKRRKLKSMGEWSEDVAASILDERIDCISLADRFTVTPAELLLLRGQILGIYRSWACGDDIMSQYPKSTFYRYRRKLLALGIDICSV